MPVKNKPPKAYTMVETWLYNHKSRIERVIAICYDPDLEKPFIVREYDAPKARFSGTGHTAKLYFDTYKKAYKEYKETTNRIIKYNHFDLVKPPS